MKKNVGTIDASMRITCGLAGLAWATSKMVRRPYSSIPLLAAVLSAMKVAEGITRYCPLLDVFNVSTLSKEEQQMQAKEPAAKAEPEQTQNKEINETQKLDAYM